MGGPPNPHLGGDNGYLWAAVSFILCCGRGCMTDTQPIHRINRLIFYTDRPADVTTGANVTHVVATNDVLMTI